MQQIYIKGFFGNWKKSTKEQAIKFCKTFLDGCLCGKDKGIELLNQNHLRGITYDELIKGAN